MTGICGRKNFNLTAEWEQEYGPGKMSYRKSKLKQTVNDEDLEIKPRLTPDYRRSKSKDISKEMQITECLG